MIIRRYRAPNRISKLIRAPGGITIAAALDRAADALDEVRDKCVAAIDAKVERIARLAASPECDYAEMYGLANEVFGEAGVFDMRELSTAAHSLCDLLDLNAGAQAHAAVKVHADAMRALLHPDVSGDAARREAVLTGLHRVTARFSEAGSSVINQE